MPLRAAIKRCRIFGVPGDEIFLREGHNCKRYRKNAVMRRHLGGVIHQSQQCMISPIHVDNISPIQVYLAVDFALAGGRRP